MEIHGNPCRSTGSTLQNLICYRMSVSRASGTPCGSVFGRFCVSRSRTGVTLEPLWRTLEQLWGTLVSLGSHLGATLGHLGGTLGHFGGTSGLVWGHIGMTLGHFGVSLVRLRVHEGHLEVTLVQFQEIFIFQIDFNDFLNSSGHLGIDLGSFGGRFGVIFSIWGDFGGLSQPVRGRKA